jgi:hypothetical protein
MEVSSQLHIAAVLSSRKIPWQPLARRLSGPQTLWTLRRLENSSVPAENPTPIIAFASHYNRWSVRKVNVYDRSVLIWYWQLSPNTYMFQAPQKKWNMLALRSGPLCVYYHVTGYNTNEWMNDTDSHLDRAATRSGTAVRYQSKSYACLTVLQLYVTSLCRCYTALWTELQRPFW